MRKGVGRRGREGIRRKRKSPWPDLETEFTALARYVGPFSLTLSIFDDHFFVLFFFFLVFSILARKKENLRFYSIGFGISFVHVLSLSLALSCSPLLSLSFSTNVAVEPIYGKDLSIYLSLFFSFLFFFSSSLVDSRSVCECMIDVEES